MPEAVSVGIVMVGNSKVVVCSMIKLRRAAPAYMRDFDNTTNESCVT